MRLAREIHDAQVAPLAVEVPGFAVAGASFPAAEVGGDLVDAAPCGDRLVAYIADVSGHGVRASALMAMLKAAARMRLRAPAAPDELLADLNRVLFELKRPDMFATCAGLALGPPGEVRVALAGHWPLLRVRRGIVERAGHKRPARGLRHDERFVADAVAVEPGDVLALISDGVSEAADRGGRHLGIDGIERVLAAHAAAPLKDLLERILAAAREHGPQHDDRTVLLVRVLGTGPAVAGSDSAGD